MSIPLNLALSIDQIAFLRPQSPTPHFVAYSDMYGGSAKPPPPSSIKGFNTFNLGFLLLEGAWDNAQLWTTLTPDERSSVKSQYAAAGIKLLVSAFGSTDLPTTSGADPIATANKFAGWVKTNQLDGIDIDYEDLNAFEKGDGSAENWLIAFTQQLRLQLPAGQYLITHAPVAPWFQPDRWGGGGYLKIHASVGHLIDWYNIQFYNQGPTEYITCPSLLTTSSSSWPNTTVFQIAAHGVPLSKIVIGKPATPADASNGFMDPMTLASCLAQGKDKGWTGGAMVWQYPHADSGWITEVRSNSWPVA
ncbi:glycoside hydrolase family 18 protein [Amanita muscaria Koide BX008]|uniref:chitinase n=1 Tax=Amanita muscaria (strain Koide BX008) TaxID=946122 RepID=A0A0C2TPW2_AMAMK|nr:glycoside hydrolase family 18 protein [Amanita muscaria Koide BX008]